MRKFCEEIDFESVNKFLELEINSQNEFYLLSIATTPPILAVSYLLRTEANQLTCEPTPQKINHEVTRIRILIKLTISKDQVSQMVVAYLQMIRIHLIIKCNGRINQKSKCGGKLEENLPDEDCEPTLMNCKRFIRYYGKDSNML